MNDNFEPLESDIQELASTIETAVATMKSNISSLNTTITSVTDDVESLAADVFPIGAPRLSLDGVLDDGEIWLEGAEVSKDTYSALYEVYGDTYGTPDDSYNFLFSDYCTECPKCLANARLLLPCCNNTFIVTHNLIVIFLHNRLDFLSILFVQGGTLSVRIHFSIALRNINFFKIKGNYFYCLYLYFNVECKIVERISVVWQEYLKLKVTGIFQN